MGMHRRTAAKLIAGFGLTAAAMPVFAQGKTVEVSMGRGKMVFLPASITIASGDTVKWTNPAVVLHSVTFDPAAAVKPENVALPPGVKPFDSGDMGQDATFSHTFTEKGTYKYICKMHEAMGMIGTVIVT
jgi:plastocyanin